MAEESRQDAAGAAMDRINRAWLDGRVEELAPLVHPAIVMVLPGFAGGIAGRDAFIAGFHDFVSNATVHEFRERDRRVDVAGETAVVSIRYEMVYERGGNRYAVTGRDLWVLEHSDGGWLAVWRAMLDVEEQPA